MIVIRLSKGAIVGIAIGAVLALMVLIIILRRLCPSIFRKIFCLKGRSNQNRLVTEAFAYQPLSATSETTLGHASTTTQVQGFTTQTPPSMFQPTPPTSGGGLYAAPADVQLPGTHVRISRFNIHSPRCEPYHLIPQTQVITVPFTLDGKYRPDLVPAPRLMSPPQGPRRLGSISTEQSVPSSTSQNQQLRSNRSQPNIATVALPRGARRPVPAASLDNMRGAVGRAEGQEALLSPLRRQVNVKFRGASPPRYGRDF